MLTGRPIHLLAAGLGHTSAIVGDLDDVTHALIHRLGHDAVGFVELLLNGTATCRFVDGILHGRRYRIAVQDHLAFGISRRAADGLDQRALAAQEAFFIGIQNGYQRNLRQVQTLAQQVDAYQHLKLAQTQVTNQFHSLDGLDIMVHIPHLDAFLLQIIGQVLCHPFGQGGDQHTLVLLLPQTDLVQQIIDLPFCRPHFNFRIQQAGGADDLLHDLAGAAALVLGGGCADVNDLVGTVLELLKVQRSVIQRRGQAEAVIYQHLFSGPVTVIHRPDLGQHHVAFINEQQVVLGEIVHQSKGCAARRPARQHTGIVLDAGTKADLPHHFNVIAGALGDALGLDELAFLLKPLDGFFQFCLDIQNCLFHFISGNGIMRSRINGHMIYHPLHRAGERMDLGDPVDFIAKELHADGIVIGVRQMDLYRITPHTEPVAVKV